MTLQSKIIKALELKGYLVLKTIRLNKAGYPDIFAFGLNNNLFIEVKEGNDTLKPLQRKRIDELNKLGKIAFCYHTDKIIYPKNITFDIFAQ